jgi:hypothetical protein
MTDVPSCGVCATDIAPPHAYCHDCGTDFTAILAVRGYDPGGALIPAVYPLVVRAPSADDAAQLAPAQFTDERPASDEFRYSAPVSLRGPAYFGYAPDSAVVLLVEPIGTLPPTTVTWDEFDAAAREALVAL